MNRRQHISKSKGHVTFIFNKWDKQYEERSNKGVASRQQELKNKKEEQGRRQQTTKKKQENPPTERQKKGENVGNMSTNNTAEEMNRKMVKFLPELASSFAVYPMRRDRWYSPTEKGPNGQALYIASSNNGIKLDYVYGRGQCGEGYYSLLTKVSYINLYSRVSNECPSTCCACTKEARIAYDEWDDVKRLMHARQASPIPDDGVAKDAAIRQAKDTAQAYYHGTQFEQLGVMAVQNAVR